MKIRKKNVAVVVVFVFVCMDSFQYMTIEIMI